MNDNMNYNDNGYNEVYVQRKTNGIAIAGFVCSFLIPLLGLILSIIGFKKSKETNDCRDLSIAGITISSFGLLISFILTFIFFMAFMSEMYYYY